MSVERELEHTVEGEAGELATLSEEQANLVQMQQIAEQTVEPGVMRLPVKTVTTAENSEQWAIELDHPVEGTLRFYRKKPRYGWHDDQELVELLRWYEIHDRDPYKLQIEQLYAEHDPDEADQHHGWCLAEPPWVAEKEAMRRRQRPLHERVGLWIQDKRPAREIENVWALLWLGSVLAPLFTVFVDSMIGAGVATMVTISMLTFISMTIFAMILTTPPGDGR